MVAVPVSAPVAVMSAALAGPTVGQLQRSPDAGIDCILSQRRGVQVQRSIADELHSSGIWAGSRERGKPERRCEKSAQCQHD